MSDLDEKLKNGFELLNIPVTAEQLQKFECFAQLLLKWNKVYNLTAITNEDDVLTKHLLDSVSILPYLEGYLNSEKPKVLDVGCGGGLPGIPLAILLNQVEFDLIDTVSKKIAFVRQAAINLKLSNLEAINGRVEQYKSEYKYDLITCRAFSSLNNFVSLTKHLIKPNGYWLAMKGKVPLDEIKDLPSEVELEKIIELSVPFAESERNLLVLKMKKS